ncbi:extracellular solute-binding protein [Paenibacillus cymbidii]|uniref:extracellular solute-binding protein n=1 Tax=Paenibacillus cymbidii TaxID=1639034 RepID=UPI0010817E0B|nr:extracellular solute-binding protein [Paenibacillus cymbidii]
MNKVIARLTLLLALLALLLAACGSKGSSDGSASSSPSASPIASPAASAAVSPYGDTGGLKLPLVDKPTTLTWMMISDHTNMNESMLAKEIEKRTGIKLDIQAYPAASYMEKLRVVLASGKLPDIFHGLSPAEVNKMGVQGALTPINPYLDKLPNFKKLYVDNKDNSWVMKSWSDDKNNLYTWPIYGLQRDVNHGFLFRKDVFDKLGIKEWTTTDEFYQALKKLKEAYPQSYPFASKYKEAIFEVLAFGWGIGSHNGVFPAYYDEQAKTWKLAYTAPEYKAMLDFMKKLFNEGLLDPEFITDTDASWTSKMTTNKAFVTFDWIGRMEAFANQVKSQMPDYNLRYGNPVGPTGHVRSLPRIDNVGLAVANNANKETALKLLDYLTSPSGASLVTMGVEGETYKLENGKPVYSELKDAPTVDINVLQKKYGLWANAMYLRPDKRSVYFNFTAKEQEAQDKIVKSNKFETPDPMPKFTDEETKTLADLKVSLDKAAQEFSTKYIMKKEMSDADWTQWLQSAEKLGASKFVGAYNAAQKRYDEIK